MFGAEFVAMKHGIETVRGIRYKLRMMSIHNLHSMIIPFYISLPSILVDSFILFAFHCQWVSAFPFPKREQRQNSTDATNNIKKRFAFLSVITSSLLL